MASYEQKVKERCSFSVPQGWVSQLIFSMCWNPEDVGSNASEGKDALTKQGQTGKEQIFFISLCSRRKCGPSCLPVCLNIWIKGVCLPESRSKLRAVSSHCKIWIKGMYLPTSKVQTGNGWTHFKLTRKSLTDVLSISGL